MKAGSALGTLAVLAVLAYAALSGGFSPARILEGAIGDALEEVGIEIPAPDVGSIPELPTAEGAADGPATSQYAPEAMAAADAQYALDGIAVAEVGSMAGYSRERFEHWSNARDFGWDVDPSCDVRDAALLRDGENVEVGAGCRVGRGAWLDPYTGTTYIQPSDVDIDHVVPLANAWRSGASAWTDSDREAYANSPGVLLAVEDDANQEKGDKGPEAWVPPNANYHCSYATKWINVKSYWSLTINPREKAALQEMLAGCQGS